MEFKTVRSQISYQEALPFRERFGQQLGSEVTRLCLVSWSQYRPFIKDILADVSRLPFGQGAGLVAVYRRNPEPHPLFPWLFASETELVDPVGIPQGTDGQPNYLNVISNTREGQFNLDGMARVVVTYRPITYDLASDDTAHAADNTQNELVRNITRTSHYSSEAAQVGGNAFKWVPSGAITDIVPSPIGMEAPAKVLALVELRYRWHMVPTPVPAALLSVVAAGGGNLITLGRVNSTPFDSNSLLGSALPVCTGLYTGCEISEAYFSPTGTRCVDVEIPILYRPQGWNFLFRRSRRTFVEVSDTGEALQQLEPNAPNDRRPYNSFNLASLFRL